jgi:DNA-binding NarL/FixJ family response regulator
LGKGLERSYIMKQRSDEFSLRRRLLGGESVYGLVIKAPAPALVEMCAAAEFDFAFIDAEHGGGEAFELEHHVRAGESFGMPSVVRIGSHQPAEILRALDIGAEGIIVPHVNTRAEAEAIVQAAHDAKAWTAKGASFVALASTLLIADCFSDADFVAINRSRIDPSTI